MARTLADLKQGDTFPCPLCHRHFTMYDKGDSKGNMRPHNASWNQGGGKCDGGGFNPFRVSYPQLVRLVGKARAVQLCREQFADMEWVPVEDEPGYRRPRVKLDLTESGKGIVLVTGSRFETPPQALLGRREKGGWYLEDTYGDDGRKDYHGGAKTKETVVARYMEFLGYAPGTWDLKVDKEY